MSEKDFLPDSEVLASLVSLFERADPESRERLYQTLGTYLGLRMAVAGRSTVVSDASRESGAAISQFTEDRSLTAKEFVTQKQPQTDVERVACLAYYLTHYLDVPRFKTVDISRVNTDAAQVKFSNAAFSVQNATKYGYLVHGGKGLKQLSALGEEYVAALPDRAAAREVMNRLRARRRSRRKRSRTGPSK